MRFKAKFKFESGLKNKIFCVKLINLSLLRSKYVITQLIATDLLFFSAKLMDWSSFALQGCKKRMCCQAWHKLLTFLNINYNTKSSELIHTSGGVRLSQHNGFKSNLKQHFYYFLPKFYQNRDFLIFHIFPIMISM